MAFRKGDRVEYTGEDQPTYLHGDRGTCSSNENALHVVLVRFDGHTGSDPVDADDLRLLAAPAAAETMTATGAKRGAKRATKRAPKRAARSKAKPGARRGKAKARPAPRRKRAR